jgi:hypothetical protein
MVSADSSPPSRLRLPPARRLLRLCADPAGPAALLLAALLALWLAYQVYGGQFMRGLSGFWLSDDSDLAQYISGFNAYVHEPWHWPLLRIESVNWPDGTLATFLDTIPLYALVLKLLRHGPDVRYSNPYVGWIMLCYLLQGAGAWWICREAQLRSWAALAALTVLLATFPALTFRIHHISLMSQWLLLFAFALYLRGSRLGRLAGGGWTALLIGGFYINIYLFSMLSLLFGADALRHLRNGGWRQALPALLGAPLLLGLSLWLTMLPLAPAGQSSEWGFGFYSMNLLSPIAGGDLLRFATPMATTGQGEGYNYLGVFLLLFTAGAIRLRQRHDGQFCRRHAVLLWMLALLALYALSNNVYLGAQPLYTLELPEWTRTVTDQLRASGRFFWPVGYAVVIFTVVSVQRHAGRARAAALLALLVGLQWWDLQGHHRSARNDVDAPQSSRVEAALWDAFLGPQVDTLMVYPPFGCGTSAGTQTILPTMRYAVKRQLKMSTGYVARLKKPCDNYAREIGAAQAPGTAFVFIKQDFPSLASVRQLLGEPPQSACVDANFAYLCKRQQGVEKTD